MCGRWVSWQSSLLTANHQMPTSIPCEHFSKFPAVRRRQLKIRKSGRQSSWTLSNSKQILIFHGSPKSQKTGYIRCLIKDYDKRPSPQELLRHPFILQVPADPKMVPCKFHVWLNFKPRLVSSADLNWRFNRGFAIYSLHFMVGYPTKRQLGCWS